MKTRMAEFFGKAGAVALLAALLAGGVGGVLAPREAAAGPLPDLVVRSIQVDGVYTTVTVVNRGWTRSGGFVVNLTGRGGRSYSAWVPAIYPWNYEVVTFQEAESGCGVRTAVADATNLVAEANESNNVGWLPYNCDF